MKASEKFEPIFRKHDVLFAVVYGSVYRGEDSGGSDIDTAVYLEGDKDHKDYTERYISLINSLNNISEKKVDTTDIRTCRRTFASRISRNSKIIYNPKSVAGDKLDKYKSDYPDSKEIRKKREELKNRINERI